MTNNHKNLNEARVLTKEFETERQPDQLREACVALENVVLKQERDPQIRKQLRTDSLSLWLQILQLLDRLLDPKFDPEDLPKMAVEPPPTSDGTQYPPGADPALIDDPGARAAYQKAIAANEEKAVQYRLQIGLRRLNDRIPPRADDFIRTSYTSSQADQDELRTAIDREITNARRKADLLKLVKSRQP